MDGNIEWRRIEALLLALGASRTERAGAAVSFELNGVVAQFHHPHQSVGFRGTGEGRVAELSVYAGGWPLKEVDGQHPSP